MPHKQFRQSVFLRPAMLLALLLPGLALAVDPAYETAAIPEKEDEAQLWESASKHEMRRRNAGTVFRDLHMERYLEDLADRLIGDRLDHLGIEIDFILLREPTLSGWVYPYGTIGLHTGLLVRMDNEAQLAAIVAHEISHFMQRHTYREMLSKNRNKMLGKGLGLLMTAVAARETGNINTDILDVTENFWTNLSVSGYSKKNEYVADEEGLTLMLNAGYALDEALPAFEALGENSAYGAGDPRKMWSSHPRLEDRLSNLRKEIRKVKRQRGFQPGTVPAPEDYYRGIAPALLINARLDLDVQQFERARESLTRYLSVHPDLPEAHYLLGETYRRARPLGPDFEDAHTAYAAALALDTAYGPALLELGMTHRIAGRNEDALDAFSRYLEARPDAIDAGIVRAYMEELR